MPFPPMEKEASGSSARMPLLNSPSPSHPATSGVHALLSELFMPHTNWTWPLSISQHPVRAVSFSTTRVGNDEYFPVGERKPRSSSSSAHINTFVFATTDHHIGTGQPLCNVRADFRLTAPPIPALRTGSQIDGYRNGGLPIPTRQEPWPPRQEPKEACSNVAFPSLRGQTSAAQACGVHGGVALQSSAPRLDVVVSKQPSGTYQLDGGVAAVIVALPNRP